jgi:hypothetical protein
MMTFKKTKENFICEHCGASVEGSGYTNHCSVCLWSKHVDIDPGDRLENCSGMMEPIEAEQKNSEWRIKSRCQKCKFERWAPLLPKDNFEVVLSLSKKGEEELR